jgi:aspartyl/glutamyl-tRNA(Asn/Gln) amidotransferase C subunit
MTARLTRDDVAKVALLGRLKLSDDELDQMTTQLGRVLEYVDILN